MLSNSLRTALLAAACVLPASYSAKGYAAAVTEFEFSQRPTDTQYRTLVQPIINATRYQFVSTAAPGGVAGFDAGIAASYVQLPTESTELMPSYVKDGNGFPSKFVLPRVTVQKGLPGDFDFGFNAGTVPGTQWKLLGGALQWTLFDSYAPAPKVAIRGGYTAFMGVDALTSTTKNMEAVASLGIPPRFSLIEPYGGVGMTWVDAQSKITISSNGNNNEKPETLKSTWSDRYFLLGLRLSLIPFVGLTGEAHISSLQTFYNAKVSVKF